MHSWDLMIHRWLDERRPDGLVCVLEHYVNGTPTDSSVVQSLIKKFAKQHVLSDGLSIYRKLQSDDQDSVRLLTVEDLIAIVQALSPPEIKEQLLKQIRQTVSDKSWRVRYMVGQHFNEVRGTYQIDLDWIRTRNCSWPKPLGRSW